MQLANVQIKDSNIAQTFAKYFETKINNITSTVHIDPEIYNGRRKIFANNQMFMTESNIRKCFKSIKCKNSEGFDRITQRVLVDGMENLITPFLVLFKSVLVILPLLIFYQTSLYL